MALSRNFIPIYAMARNRKLEQSWSSALGMGEESFINIYILRMARKRRPDKGHGVKITEIFINGVDEGGQRN